jgi:hypothetical protein
VRVRRKRKRFYLLCDPLDVVAAPQLLQRRQRHFHRQMEEAHMPIWLRHSHRQMEEAEWPMRLRHFHPQMEG